MAVLSARIDAGIRKRIILPRYVVSIWLFMN